MQPPDTQNTSDLDALFVRLSDVNEEPKRYLFRPYIPIGKLTEISAEPGTGKTKLADHIAALTTTGQSLCGIPCGKPGSVLLFSTEDDASDHRATIAACGGDLSKVFVLAESDAALDRLSKTPLTFGSPVVEQAIQRFAPSLVIFDPLQKYCGRTDLNGQTDTTIALSPAVKLARKHSCAVVLIAHNGKSHTSLQAKASGSTNIVGMMRSMLSVVTDPENPSQNLAIHTKSNNGRGKSIRYQISPIPGDPDFAGVEVLGLETYTEPDYWKAVRRSAEREFSARIDDSDAIVQTALGLIRDNPSGIRLRKQDFWTAAEMYTGAGVSDGIDSIVKRYRRFLWDKHEIFVDAKSAQTLKPFLVNGKTVDPTKSPDRCLAIYKKRVTNG